MIDAVLALTLAAVLDRAAQYVAQFERELATVASDERYVQTVTPKPSSPGCLPLVNSPCREALQLPTQTELRSTLTLRYDAARSDWAQVRDVHEVDGQTVHDPPDLSRVADLGALVDASARHNMGDVLRTINTPLFALRVLQRPNQPRFSFRQVTDATPLTVAAEPVLPGVFRTSTEVWIVEFRERSRPTIVRTPGRKDLPVRGRFWIEADSGRVFVSELVVDGDVRATIDVSYQSVPIRGLLLPIEMRERYENRKSGSRIDAIATYGRFREIQE